MSSHRKNTLVVDFSVLPHRILTDQVEEFLKDVVKLDMADVRNVQLHNLDNCLYIEMRDAGVPPRLAKKHHLRHYLEYQGILYYIPMYVDGPTTTVRIHDLPPQMSNTTISDYMQQFGKVISIHNELWRKYFAGIPNGVRVVRMRMEKSVPSHITIDGQHSLVTYSKGDKPKTIRHEKGGDKNPRHEQTSSSAAVSSAAAVDQTNQANNNDEQSQSPHDEDDDENDDCEKDNELETTTKRRLSTRPSSEENEGTYTRSPDQESEKEVEGNQSPDSGWRITRSRKYRKVDI